MQRLTVFALASALSVGAPLIPLAADEAETIPVAAGGATGQITGTVMVVNTETRKLTYTNAVAAEVTSH